MKPEDFRQTFAEAHPVAVDFPRKEYERQEPEVSKIAHEAGYRLAGFRLGRAVFTTKPRE